MRVCGQQFLYLSGNMPTTAQEGGDFSATLGGTAISGETDCLGRPIYPGGISLSLHHKATRWRVRGNWMGSRPLYETEKSVRVG